MRVARRDNRGTAFADLVWKPRVLIELKKAGRDMQRDYRQAFEHWIDLIRDRPQYVMLCNFDAFCVYDLNRQLESRMDGALPGHRGRNHPVSGRGAQTRQLALVQRTAEAHTAMAAGLGFSVNPAILRRTGSASSRPCHTTEWSPRPTARTQSSASGRASRVTSRLSLSVWHARGMSIRSKRGNKCSRR
jgi:hypothetical protein